jgi:hypothetical protein
MWTRLPVGRLDVLPHDDWDEYGMRQCRPTWAFFYDKVEPYVGKTKTMYKYYSNEFDSLTPGMVNFHTLRITFRISTIPTIVELNSLLHR